MKLLHLVMACLSLVPSYLIGQNLVEYRTGNPQNFNVQALGGTCMMGGGSEHNEAMRWFLERANGGDVLVLRTSGSDGYNNYMYTQLGVSVNSVTTIVCLSPSASNDPILLAALQNSEAIWFAGGDQFDYVSYWRETAVDSIINYKVQQEQMVIGGTSAGMAILGSSYFSAENGTTTSSTVLANPYDISVSVDTSVFLKVPFLDHLITDTHYDNPDRKGRHMGFMGRYLTDANQNQVYGIACDEYTAVCIDTNGIARVFGDYPAYDDNAYFLSYNCESQSPEPEICQAGQPLTWSLSGEAIRVYAIKGTSNGQNWFNLNDWTSGNGGSWEFWFVQNGTLFSSNGQAPNCNNSASLTEAPAEFNFFPNPASSSLILSFFPKPPSEIQLISPVGELVAAIENPGTLELFWPLPDLSPGIYTIHCHFQDQVSSKKLMIAYSK